MTHTRQEENVAAYALGALPELEAQVFERHLMGCGACQEDLRRARLAVEALLRSVVQCAPPPTLRKSLMAAVSAEAAPAAAASRSTPEPRPARRAWIPRFRPGAELGAACAALVLALVAGTLSIQRPDARTVTASVDQIRLPDARATLLVPGDEARGAMLRVQGLPDPGRDRVYQVWLRRDGEVVPVSIFDIDSEGSGAAAIPESLEDASAVMVTRERRGGSPIPTEDPAITADV